MYQRFLKRWIDVLLSGLGLLVLAIPMGVVAILIKLDDPGRAIFCQRRMGQHRQAFALYKFRSMKAGTPEVPTCRMQDPQRYITRLGRFLRRTSIDELPQLWNIFKGDMSMIGPRPVLPEERELLQARERYGANDIRPGLTGWAQINGRDALDDPTKARLDGEYVQKQSFGFDVMCFFKTIASVLKGEGVIEGAPQKLDES